MTAELVYGLMGLALGLYLLTGGADFGGGIWDLFARGDDAEAQRAAIAKAIAPIWEANHIWIIFVVVLMFTVFPVAFAAVGIALHIPLTAALIGIVLRGSAFVFRAYGLDTPTWRSGWGRVFAVSSLLTPACLGAAFAGLATGDIRWDGAITSGFWAGWTTAFAGLAGLMTVALCALLAAAYLCLETEAPLRDRFRARALAAQVAVGVFGLGALGLARGDAAGFFARLTDGLGWVILGLTMAAGGATLWALWRRRHRLARIAAMAQGLGALAGFGWAMDGMLVRPDLPLSLGGAREATLDALGPALIAGGVVLAPALWLLYRVFTGRAER